MTRSQTRSFLLMAALPALLPLGCNEAVVSNGPPPNTEIAQPAPAPPKTSTRGKKVTKPPLTPSRSPSKED